VRGEAANETIAIAPASAKRRTVDAKAALRPARKYTTLMPSRPIDDDERPVGDVLVKPLSVLKT